MSWKFGFHFIIFKYCANNHFIITLQALKVINSSTYEVFSVYKFNRSCFYSNLNNILKKCYGGQNGKSK